MQRETRLIAIGGWTGPAYLIDGAWYVRPQSIIEFMGLDWVKIRKKVVVRFADDIKLLEKTKGLGIQKPLIMRLEVAVQWLARFDGNNHMDDERRVIARQMGAAIANQFAAMALETGMATASDEIVLRGCNNGR